MVSQTDELSFTRSRLMYATVFAILAAGCSSTSQSIIGPSSTKCSLAAAADTATFPPDGGRGQISVTTNRECEWTASTSDPWIKLSGTTTGQGEARLSFSVVANGEPSIRRGAISIGDEQVAITQQAGECQFAIKPEQASVPPEGGRGTLQVTASSPLCAWTARSDAAWLSIVDGGQGKGNGEVLYEAHATSGPPRNGLLTIAGRSVIVAQGDGCATSLSSTAQAVGADGGPLVVSVTAGEGCAWAPSSAVPWVTITSGLSGSGTGDVGLAVAANTGPERQGVLTIGARPFIVTQASGCNLSITPAGQAVASGGGAGTASVTVGAGCPWTTSASEPWVQITAGASGVGPGAVTFAVAAHDGPARQASLTIGGRPFTIQQESGCTFAFSAPGIAFGPDGGGGAVQLLTANGCGWTASDSESWIHISSARAGTGPDLIKFVANPNPGPERRGTISVEGQLYFVRQRGAED
jgi:hypothetical protein